MRPCPENHPYEFKYHIVIQAPFTARKKTTKNERGQKRNKDNNSSEGFAVKHLDKRQIRKNYINRLKV